MTKKESKRVRTEINVRLKVEVYELLKKKAWFDRVTLSQEVAMLLGKKGDK